MQHFGKKTQVFHRLAISMGLVLVNVIFQIVHKTSIKWENIDKIENKVLIIAF